MLFNKTLSLIAVVLFAVLASCSKSYVDPAVAAIADNAAAIVAYNTENNLKAQKAPTSGMYYVITNANPTGKLPAVGDEVGYTYKYITLKNVVIDTKGDTVIYAPYGTGQLITDEPLKYLRTGETGTFLLPSDLAFYDRTITYTVNNQTQTLPAYSPIRLDLKLVSSLTEDERIDQYVAANKLTVTEKTASGLRFIKTKDNPSGAVLATGQIVSVVYSGRTLRSSQPFDSGTFPITLGQKQSVPGFEEGVSKLKVGEKATIIFPSAQGYGVQGRTNSKGELVIRPYDPLVFDIEIVSAK